MGFIAKLLRRRAASRDIVCAKEFRVVDDAGITRAWFGLTAEGQPFLDMYDDDCVRTVSICPFGIGLFGHDKAICFWDDTGTGRMMLAVSGSGASLDLSDASGQNRLTVGLLDGDPSATLYDDAGRSRATVTIIAGEPRIWLFDENHNPVFEAPEGCNNLPGDLTGRN